MNIYTLQAPDSMIEARILGSPRMDFNMRVVWKLQFPSNQRFANFHIKTQFCKAESLQDGETTNRVVEQVYCVSSKEERYEDREKDYSGYRNFEHYWY
jgi:hypothetical protein